ncbi:MAG: carbohydrate transporter ATP-binding protein family [Gammaproteobacteria bacterium]|nr:carbohydrate transporter ATP-binding protein family [Gammaproteobacteria bacterium]
MAQVTVENIVKKFGSVTAVDDVSLKIPDGAFVILVGPSGCGKTSLLRLLAGLEDATSGRILIGDKDVTRVHPRERDIAMVFQSYALYPHMSVRRNMSFALELRKVAAAEIERRVAGAADILGIGHLLDRQPKQLSGGQRQRVALGRAIVREPAVFLFDEPLSNLDAKLRTAMRGELIRLHKRLGTTVVYVTHDQVEAMTMGEIVVVMKDGAVQQAGAPLDIYRDPENLFVAEFIGSPSMNLLRGRADPGQRRVVSDQGGLHLPFDGTLGGERPSASREMVIGIRPEHLSIGPGPAAGEVALEGVVEVVEPLGAETMVEFNCSGVRILARITGDVLPAVGETLRLCAELRRFYFFDAATGERIPPAAA